MDKMQLTLVFNPAYDGGAYVPEQGEGHTRFFQRYVGEKGLLDELELRLGLTAQEPTRRQMLAAYLHAVQKVADGGGKLFCARSLKLAPLATAKELLAWRDELVLAGWTAESPVPDGLTVGAKSILNGLAAVEKELPAGFRTESDRWQTVLAELEKSGIPKEISVLLTVDEKHLHPLFKTLFRQLRQQGIDVDAEVASHSPKVEVKHFRDSVDACLWAVAKADKSLLVCSDSQTLGAATAAFGQAQVNTVSSNTPKPVEHLFVSAMMLLKDGGDLQAMRDYLSAPSHPLRKHKVPDDGKPTLQEALLDHINNTGGFGEDRKHRTFRNIVEEYAGTDASKRDEFNRFLPAAGEKLTFGRVRKMCDKLSEWAQDTIRAADEKPEMGPFLNQWSALADYCNEMVFQCRELGYDKLPEINPDSFVQTVRSVYDPDRETVVQAEVGSVPVAAGIENIAGKTGDVIWIDGAFTPAPVPLSFLCKKDILTLANIVPYVWNPEDALALQDDLFKAGLARIGGTLSALFCDSFRGEKKEKHPFIVKEGHGVKALEESPYEEAPKEKTTACVTRKANNPIVFPCSMDAKGLKFPDHVSPTSLELLFERPFDWFVQNVLGLSVEWDTNLNQIEGVVAHDIIHKLYKEAAVGGVATADDLERVFGARFDAIFDQSILDTGAELSYAENSVERDQFKTVLREESIPELIRILRFSALTVVGSEVECKDVDLSDPDPASGLEPLRVNAVIDLLLKNPAGNYVILDFKWTGSKTGKEEREKQIKRGTDYQLALYRAIVQTGTKDIEKGTVDAQGFYMLHTSELLTSQAVFYDGPHAAIDPLQAKKTPDETMAEIRELYSSRIRELRSGTIPAGKPAAEKYSNNKVLMGKLN